MNEICKNQTKGYKLFSLLLVYMIVVMYIFNNTVAKVNLLLSDTLTLLFICAGVYFLYRYSVISYRYVLSEDSITISKILGKNNEQVQISIDYKDVVSFEKTSEKTDKKVLNYCATLNRNNRYVLKAKIDDEEYTLVFQPSDEFSKEFSERKDKINEEI